MLNEQTMLESKVSAFWLSCIDCCACSIDLFLKQAIWLIRKAQVCLLFYSVQDSVTVSQHQQCEDPETEGENGNHSYSSQPGFLLTVTCRDRIRVTFRNYEPGFWNTPQTLHTCMYTEQQHSEVKMCPPVCVPTLCCNFFFSVCVHVWVCVRHSAVCFTSCAPGRVITHLCLRTSHLLLKAEDSLSWCQIVVLTVVLKFSSPCSLFCFVRNLFGFNLPDSLLCRCFQLSPTCKEKPLKKRKSVKWGFICLPPSLSSQKEDPQLIYKLYSVWNLFKVLVLSNL